MKTKPTYQELEKELAISKKKNKSQVLLDYAGVMFIELDLNGNIILVNKKTCEIFVYKEEEMLGENWVENFIPERLKKEILPISKKLLSGEIETVDYFENPILTKNGEERLIYWHNTVIRDENGNITSHLSSGEDITERKQAEIEIKKQNKKLKKAKAKVEESEEQFRCLFKNINVGSALHKIITNKNNVPIDFVWLDANPAYEKLTLLKCEDIIGKRGLEVIPNLEQRWIDLYGEVAQTGKSRIIINYSEYLDSYWEVHAYSPKKNLFAVALKDITKRIKAEQKQKKTNEKLDAILNAFNDGVYLCSEEYNIEYLNPSMINKIGRNAVGEKCYKAIYNEDEPCSWCNFNELKNKKSTVYSEIEKDSKNYFVTSALLENNSKLTIYHDITKVKTAENKIKIQNKELKKAKK
ncbi:MAG: PAS domain S-box protein [Draconibacterium sp.]|nr:PAS domain S-box protein [Draconibacterium sp.]